MYVIGKTNEPIPTEPIYDNLDAALDAARAMSEPVDDVIVVWNVNATYLECEYLVWGGMVYSL